MHARHCVQLLCHSGWPSFISIFLLGHTIWQMPQPVHLSVYVNLHLPLACFVNGGYISMLFIRAKLPLCSSFLSCTSDSMQSAIF